MSRIDVQLVRGAASGRWVEILSTVGGIAIETLDGQHHPCPKCGGTDRFRLVDPDAGAVLCNQCFSSKNGDGFAAVQWMRGIDFIASLKLIADHLGIQPEQKKKAKDPTENLEFEPWNDNLIAMWCAENNVVPAALAFSGARLAVYRKRHQVIAMPAWGKGLLDAGPVGWFLKPLINKTLPAWENKKKIDVKHKMTSGSKTGIFGEGALRVLLSDPMRPIYRLEGASDMWRAQGRHPTVPCISFSHGVGNIHPWMLEIFRGRNVVSAWDADHGGIRGLQKLIDSIAPITSSLAVFQIPYAITESKGKDYSDLIADNYEDLVITVDQWKQDPRIAPLINQEGAVEVVSQEGSDRIVDRLRNYREIRQDEFGHPLEEPIFEPLTMQEMAADMRQLCGEWPKVLCNSLIWRVEDRIEDLMQPYDLTAFVARHSTNTEFKLGKEFITRNEFFRDCRSHCDRIESIEYSPHFPPRDDTYYMCEQPEPADAMHHLNHVLDFLNPETDVDRLLILSLIVTVFWSRAGAKPAFFVTAPSGRGAGKSKLIDLCAQIADTGVLNINQMEKEDKMLERIMSPLSRRQRIIRLDNVKSEKLGWQALEAMITSPILSGRQMYVGEAWRRNTMTWTLTGNSPGVTTDIAQRTVFIHLGRPTYGSDWEGYVFGYVKQHRQEIWREIAHFFARPVQENYQAKTRWAEWEREILSRIGNTDATLGLMRERAITYDADRNECRELIEIITNNLDFYATPNNIFVPTTTLLKWLRESGQDRVTTRSIGRVINQAINEGHLKDVKSHRTKSRRGFIFHANDSESVDYRLISDM